MTGYQHDALQCEVLKIEVDYKRCEAWLYMAEGDCCDMGGCTELFTALHPGVIRIFTRSGDNPDTLYQKIDREWRAFAARLRDGQWDYELIDLPNP
jgi:hypothetical protein